uniref:Cytochrome c oxidase polypeptide II n=1 Tax=Jenufa perforata TaxID=993091 RepID=A0A6G7ITU7_9CHLO|nr:cytochrome c oxidase subunit 2 [Jenufa perforata]QII41618.1 cytochrome c oxidase subunit 2 [Jenufa perforata]
MQYLFYVKTYADAPVEWQTGFQDPATSTMEAIIDLHHDLMFFLIAIFTLVVYVGARVCWNFHWSKQPVAQKFNHHTNLELIWAILPSLIVMLIALPSLTLIYSFDHHVDNPALTVRVVGIQWAWRYELKEHVTSDFAQPNRLLELD